MAMTKLSTRPAISRSANNQSNGTRAAGAHAMSNNRYQPIPLVKSEIQHPKIWLNSEFLISSMRYVRGSQEVIIYSINSALNQDLILCNHLAIEPNHVMTRQQPNKRGVGTACNVGVFLTTEQKLLKDNILRSKPKLENVLSNNDLCTIPSVRLNTSPYKYIRVAPSLVFLAVLALLLWPSFIVTRVWSNPVSILHQHNTQSTSIEIHFDQTKKSA
jgi:hypothetical protein